MIEIELNDNRKVLAEGRNYGVGFTYAKKLSDNKFKGIYPISPCKDYLNDTILTEQTGQSFTKYGLKSNKTDVFKDGVYLLVSSCHYKESTYSDYDKTLERLNKVELINQFMNYFESKLNTSSTYTKVNDNLFLVEVDPYWIQSSYHISFFSMIIRISIWWDGKKSIEEYLKKKFNTESETVNVSFNSFFEALLNNNIKTQEFDKPPYTLQPSAIHSHGFQYYYNKHLKST